MRRAEVDARTALFGEGPGGVVVSGPRETRCMELSTAKRCRERASWRSARWAASAFAITAGAATIDVSVEDARSVFSNLRLGRDTSREQAANSRCHGRRRSARSVPRTRGREQLLDDRDGPRDECGVFGVYAPEHDVARLAYFALYALQHRGQESAGIATCENGHITTQRDLGPRLPGLRRAQPAGPHRRQRRSATCATRPPAAAAGTTRSPSTATTAARSRSPTTATSSTRSSSTTS